MGVPVSGGFKREDLYHDPRNERTRCSAWVQTGNASILIDAGPEFRIQSIRSGITSLNYVLITHEHMDHIAGLDDLRMYNYINENPIPVYATQTAVDSIQKRFDYMFGENKYPGSTSLELIPVTGSFELDGLTITPLPVTHGDLEILGFRLNDVAYLTDVKDIPDATMALLKGCKTIILSALRWEPEHPTHLTIPQAVDIINKLDAEKAYLIHMNSFVDHQETNARLPEHIRLAYDMMSFNF